MTKVTEKDFVRFLHNCSPAPEPTIPIGTAHLDPEPPPNGANVGKPYTGVRPEMPARMGELKVDAPEERAKEIMESDRIRLNIGADRTQISGFLSVDFNEAVHPDVLAEATALPFEDDTVDEIYASHVLEHLTWHEGMKALKEWYRVLKPGGQLTVAVPDITQIYMLYKHGTTWGDYNQRVSEIYVQAVAFGANLLADEIPEMQDQYGGPGHKHQSIYIHDMLLNRVIEAGYVRCHEVTECFLRASALGEVMVQSIKPIPELGD
jgi:SAM-dependent methyltransferase